MVPGHSIRASDEGAAPQQFVANDPGTAARRWQALSEACRLAIIEQALRPANDRIDGFPAAL